MYCMQAAAYIISCVLVHYKEFDEHYKFTGSKFDIKSRTFLYKFSPQGIVAKIKQSPAE